MFLAVFFAVGLWRNLAAGWVILLFYWLLFTSLAVIEVAPKSRRARLSTFIITGIVLAIGVAFTIVTFARYSS